MKIPVKVKGFIEHELYHYSEYKNELIKERERIIDKGCNAPDGQPKGTTPYNDVMEKALLLCETPTTAVLAMQRTIQAIEIALDKHTIQHKNLFECFYVKRRRDIYRVCDELAISERTFSRYRMQIIRDVGIELGIVKMLA